MITNVLKGVKRVSVSALEVLPCAYFSFAFGFLPCHWAHGAGLAQQPSRGVLRSCICSQPSPSRPREACAAAGGCQPLSQGLRGAVGGQEELGLEPVVRWCFSVCRPRQDGSMRGPGGGGGRGPEDGSSSGEPWEVQDRVPRGLPKAGTPAQGPTSGGWGWGGDPRNRRSRLAGHLQRALWLSVAVPPEPRPAGRQEVLEVHVAS